MTRPDINILGIPYFPGVAVGKLHRGSDGDSTGRIVLITQDRITSLKALPAGLIVVEAAPFSHTMIALLDLGVPTVLVNAQQAAGLAEDVTLRIDGVSGRIDDDIREASPLSSSVVKNHAQRPPGQAVLMADGDAVHLCASVRQPPAAKLAAELGASAIGLVRSEFLFPADGHVPDATFYRRAFGEICEVASPLMVTFRLLDVAADKVPAWLLRSDALGGSPGAQGARLYHIDRVGKVVEAQLTALADLSNEFPLRVLVPFLVRIEEYEYWLAFIRQRIPDHVPVGAMAETPASLLDVGPLVESADFVAIGCNDLMQGLYAADRDQADLRHYLDPYAPVLFRLFRQVAVQAGGHLHRIQLCGLLPQIQGVFPVLLGLGYRTFSVDTPFIPYLANIAANTMRAECAMLATQVCSARTTLEVLKILGLPRERHVPFLTR